MKSLVIFPDEMGDLALVETRGDFFLEGIHIHAGLVVEDDLLLRDCFDPEHSVLVEKIAFSCNYRDKSYILESDKGIKAEARKGDLYFSHLGSDFVGEVIDVGKRVKGFHIGDRVIPNISYPSHSKDYTPGLPTDNASLRIEDFPANKLLKVPRHIDISNEKLAAFPIAAFTAYSMVRRAVKPQTKVLVTAAKSNTSLAVISALKNHPVAVYAMTSNARHTDKLKEMGVVDVLVVDRDLDDYAADESLRQKMEQIGKFDTIIDPFFDIYLPRVVDFLAMDSRYITCGLYDQFPDFAIAEYQYRGKNFNDMLIGLMVKNASITGNCIGLKEDGLQALEDMNNGRFDIAMDSVFSEGEESAFLHKTYNDTDRFGKVVYAYSD